MASVIPPPPPGLTYTAVIQPAVTFIVIGTSLGSLLIPILFALFFFSTPTLRKRPIFILNVVGVLLGLVLAVYNDVVEIQSLVSPLKPISNATYIGYGIITTLGPIFVDTILILRLIAVFPYSQTPKLKFFGLLAFPIAMKLLRVANLFVVASKEASLITKGGPALAVVELMEKLPNVKIEWFAQIFDNAYASAVFLWRLKAHKNGAPGAVTSRSRKSFTSGVSSLFWIAASNFVFPVIFNVIQLVIYMTTPVSNISLVLYVQQVNFYIAIIGVVFATIWATGNKWAETQRNEIGSSTAQMSTWNAGNGRVPKGTASGVSGKTAVVSYIASHGDFWDDRADDKAGLPMAIISRQERLQDQSY